jgi:hypothetical protein
MDGVGALRVPGMSCVVVWVYLMIRNKASWDRQKASAFVHLAVGFGGFDAGAERVLG